MKKILVFILLFYISTIYAQIKNQANWQQNVDYKIQVSLNDETHFLDAFLTLKYTNNSPDVLSEIWFHLWPNGYKNTTTAFALQQLNVANNTSFFYSKEKNRGYIDSLDFSVNGVKTNLTYHQTWIDVAKIDLNSALNPGDSIIITTPFRVKIPGSYSRMGRVKNSYQITQWYPKPAVYDINGWNTMPYLDQGEFYSEFGSFNVSITTPQNYVIAATGELQDSIEKEWLKDRILYYNGASSREEQTASSALLKTITFKQDSIHDFAWFADKDFYVFEGEQMLKDSSKKIKTYLYSKNSYDKTGVEYVNKGVLFYSDKVGKYPYSSASAVIGPLKAGGGMEYPMITVVSYLDEQTIIHEIGHNWFYGILGSDERTYPWMDESINTYYENRLDNDLAKKSNGNSFIKNYSKKNSYSGIGDGLKIAYQYAMLRNTDQAVNLPSTDFTSSNYGGIVYGKGAYIFGLLQSYLGDTLFDKAMKNYYEQWKFKHPLPDDFRLSIEKSTAKNLDWFFNDLLATTKTYDYKIMAIKFKQKKDSKVLADSNNFKILVKNTGNVSAPFQLTTLKKGEKEKDAWVQGFKGKKWIPLPGTERIRNLDDSSLLLKEAKRVNKRMDGITEVIINADNVLPEINVHNNRIKTKGILKTTEKIAIGGSNHQGRRTTPNIFPLVNYNYYDKWMYGFMIGNLAHWERRFTYYAAILGGNNLAPLKYEVSAKQAFIVSNALFTKVDIFAKANSFGHNQSIFFNSRENYTTYTRFNGGVDFFIKNKISSARTSQKLSLNFITLMDKQAISDTLSVGAIAKFINLKYVYNANKKINNYNFKIETEHIHTPKHIFFAAGNTLKINALMNKTFNFEHLKSALDMQFFIGGLLGATTTNFLYRVAGNNGKMDYRYENNLFARSENINSRILGARVLNDNYGGLRAPALILSQNIMSSFSFNYSFHRKIPFRPYLDIGFSDIKFSNSFISYVGGINFTLIKDFIEINLPIIYSENIRNYIDQSGIKASKTNNPNYNMFKDWHRLLVFKVNLTFDQDQITNKLGF